MSNNTTDLSRRNFLKLTACATAVTGISSLFSPAYALNNEKIAKKIGRASCRERV